MKDAERLNKALKVGRVPSPVLAVLQAIEDAGLGEHFVVVGTHALYAYETAAGVRIVQGALATQDVDLLWDARKRVRFVTDLRQAGDVDAGCAATRRPHVPAQGGPERNGHQCQRLRGRFPAAPAGGRRPSPVPFSDDEDDLWPVQAVRASVLTNAPRFDHVVVSATGRMALMRTIAPPAFVEFKRWMAKKARHRPEAKRRRDLRQAEIVQRLLDERLLAA